MKSAGKGRTIEIAPDENEMIVTFCILPRAVRTAVKEHMHALKDIAVIFLIKIDDALHAKNIDPFLNQQVPQSGSASTNYPRGIESGVNWCTGFLKYLWEHGCIRAEATPEAEERWTDHVKQMYSTMLMRKAKSWFTGYNSNIEGHEHGKIRYFVYNGGSPKYVSIINSVAENGYEGIALSPGPVVTADAHH